MLLIIVYQVYSRHQLLKRGTVSPKMQYNLTSLPHALLTPPSTIPFIFPHAHLPHPQVCHANPGERSRFIRCIYNLLNSSSPSVRYEAAGTLLTLSSAPTAIKVGSHSVA